MIARRTFLAGTGGVLLAAQLSAYFFRTPVAERFEKTLGGARQRIVMLLQPLGDDQLHEVLREER